MRRICHEDKRGAFRAILRSPRFCSQTHGFRLGVGVARRLCRAVLAMQRLASGRKVPTRDGAGKAPLDEV